MKENTEWKDTEVGKIPIDWKVENLEKSLESLIDYRGKTPKKSEKGIPTLSARSVKMGYIDYSNTFKISKETYNKFMVRGFPKKGDVLLTTEAPLGCVAILDRDDVGLAQRLITLRGKKNILDNNYLAYYLTSKQGQHELLSRASGTTVQGIKRTEFSKINIAFPLFLEQKKIAAILKSLDDKIELNNKMNETLEEMAQTIFKEWFVNFNFPNEEGKPYKDNGGKMVESELGMIPEGWRVGKLESVCDIEKGLSYKGKYLTEEGIPMVNLGSVMPGGGYRENKIKHYNGDFKERNQVYPGEIIIANTDMTQDRIILGSPFIVPNFLGNKIIFTHHLFSIKNFKISKAYIYNYLRSKKFREMAEGCATGTTVLALPKKDVLEIGIILPKDNILKIFEGIVSKLLKKQEQILEENQTLIKTRDTLLPKLMSGEIRV